MHEVVPIPEKWSQVSGGKWSIDLKKHILRDEQLVRSNEYSAYTNCLIDISRNRINFSDFNKLEPNQQDEILNYRGYLPPDSQKSVIAGEKFDQRALQAMLPKAVYYLALNLAVKPALCFVGELAAAFAGGMMLGRTTAGLYGKIQEGDTAKSLIEAEISARLKNSDPKQAEVIASNQQSNEHYLPVEVHEHFGKDMGFIGRYNKTGRQKVVRDASKRYEKLRNQLVNDLHKEGKSALKERKGHVEKLNKKSICSDRKTLISAIAKCDEKIHAAVALLDRHQYGGDKGNNRSTELERQHKAAKDEFTPKSM